MSDEALNAHLERMSEPPEEMVEVVKGYFEYLEASLADWYDRRDEKFQMYEDCKAENEALRAKLKAITCGDCGKNLLECDTVECEKIALEASK